MSSPCSAEHTPRELARRESLRKLRNISHKIPLPPSVHGLHPTVLFFSPQGFTRDHGTGLVPEGRAKYGTGRDFLNLYGMGWTCVLIFGVQDRWDQRNFFTAREEMYRNGINSGLSEGVFHTELQYIPGAKKGKKAEKKVNNPFTLPRDDSPLYSYAVVHYSTYFPWMKWRGDER